MTNAHVVAGIDRPTVRIGGVGRSYAARVVLFDPDKDVAVLYVPELRAPVLSFDDAASRGDSAVVAGYPQDGDLNLQAATVAGRVKATGRNIYNDGIVTREIYSIRSTVRPGNSGGPLLTTTGRVYGVVFARSTSDDETGYVLTAAEVAGDADAGGDGDATGGHGKPDDLLSVAPATSDRPAAHEHVVHVLPVQQELLREDPLHQESLGLVEPARGGVVAEDAQGEPAGALPAGRLDGGPQQRPCDAPAARLVEDGEALYLPDVRVARERGGHDQTDVPDDAPVQFGDQIVLGDVPLVEEGVVRRLRLAASRRAGGTR